jgi:hypothetical protein
VRNRGGWGGGKSSGNFSGLNKGPEWFSEGIKVTRVQSIGIQSASINPRSRLKHRADNEGSSVAPTAQLAHLMTQLSSLLQQHAAGSSKPFNFCEYAPKFANFCQNKNKWIVDSGATNHMTYNPNQLQNYIN